MKRIISVIAFLFVIVNGNAQQVPDSIIKSYQYIVGLIKQDKINELSKVISYPLKRENPLPDILTPKQFVAYYPTIFDAAFKKKLALYNDTDVFEHHGQYGLVGGPFTGDIWLNEDGKIAALNYSSQKEQILKSQLTKAIQNQIYPAINKWDDNIMVCKSKKLLIRLDNTKKGIRYVCWNNGGSISTKPDMILYNGIEEAQGTEGGWTWTFKNGDWTYVIDQRDMAETVAQEGLFLELSYKGVLKSSTRLHEIK